MSALFWRGIYPGSPSRYNQFEEVHEDEIKARGEAFVATIADKGKIGYSDKKKKENGPVFVYLASTSEDPKVLAQALQGMSETYTGIERYKEKSNMVDENYLATVKKHINSEQPEIVYYAMEAAGPALSWEQPTPELKAKLVEMATEGKNPGTRIAALEALSSGDGWEKDSEIAAAFIKAMKDEPAVASVAMFEVQHRSQGFADKQGLREAAAALLDHKDPGVRGRAATLAQRSVEDANRAEVISKLEAMLKDPDPFVRSEAAGALGALNSLASIEKMMPLLEQTEANTYKLTYQDMLGKQAGLQHDGSAWSRVDDAVLYSIEDASSALQREERFDYGKIDSKKKEESIAREKQRAKEWFEANKDKLVEESA